MGLARVSIAMAFALAVTSVSVPIAAQQADTASTPNVLGDLSGNDMTRGSWSEAGPANFERDLLIGSQLSGPEALLTVPEHLDEIAVRNGMTLDRLIHMLEDPTSRVDADGMVFFVEPAPDLDLDLASDGPMSTPAPLDQTFNLHSKPGSQRTIYLDFNGHIVSNTAWNNASLPNGYQAAAYDTDGNPGSFSTAERTVIQLVWARVAEDFAPFDVNVTTEDPGFDAINRSGTGDQVYGTRLVVTGSSSSGFCGGCGGVAYIGVFNRSQSHSYYQPAWCFSSSGSAKSIAECASHEVGHNLGLGHDGLQGGSTYYSGHSPWAPIMGVGYNQPVSQWSKGEYTNANNQQDDLQVMTNYGVSLRADDHGNTQGTATLLLGTTAGVISTQNDVDFFRFVAGSSGTATFSAAPAETGPNLDIRLTLFGYEGTQLAQANPTVNRVNASVASGLEASISYPVAPAQAYYIRVEGIGHGTGATGYSQYASLGAYTLSVTGMTTGQRFDSVGLVDTATGQWHLRHRASLQMNSFYFGVPGDFPFMGDWDCDGVDTPGLYRRTTGQVFLSNQNAPGPAFRSFYFGSPGDIPIAGDWNGNNCDTLSVYRPSTGQVFIVNTLPPQGGGPAADISYYFGIPGDKPFAGDFDGDGVDTVGLHRESSGFVYFRNTHTTGVAHAHFFYGIPNDRLFAGEWVPDTGIDTVGIFRPSMARVFLRYTNTLGEADEEFALGHGGMFPVAGNFGPGS